MWVCGIINHKKIFGNNYKKNYYDAPMWTMRVLINSKQYVIIQKNCVKNTTSFFGASNWYRDLYCDGIILIKYCWLIMRHVLANIL